MSVNIVDAHQHFWDIDLFDYPWMTEAVAPLRRNSPSVGLEADLG